MLNALAQLVGQTPTLYDQQVTTADGGFGVVPLLVGLVAVVVMLVSMWRVFTKAGEAGWKALIPVYDTYVLLQIVNRPVWWLLLFLIPIVNVVVGIVVYNDLVKAFGKGVGWLLLLLFLPVIGFPMLAFGNATYTQPKRSDA